MSFLKHGLQTGIAQLFSMGFSLVIGIIHARYLGPKGLGVYALLVLLHEMLYRITNFGFANSIKYYIGNRIYNFKTVYKLSIIISLVLSLIGIIIGIGLFNLPIKTWTNIEANLYYLTLSILPFNFMFLFSKSILNAKLEIRFLNIIVIIRKAIHLCLLTILIIFLRMDLMGAILAVIITEGALLLIAQYKLFLMYKKIDEPLKQTSDLSIFKNIWGYSKWSYLNLLTSFFLQKVPLLLLKQYFGDFNSIGLYSKARSLGKKSELIALPFNNLVFSYTANTDSQKENINRINALCRMYMFLMTFIIILLSIFIEHIIIFMYGTQFKESANIFYYITPAIVFFPNSKFLNGYFAAKGFVKRIFYTNISILFVTLILGYYLITSLNAIGAALTLSMSYFLLFISLLFQYTHVSKIPLSDVVLIKQKDLNRINRKVKNLIYYYINKWK